MKADYNSQLNAESFDHNSWCWDDDWMVIANHCAVQFYSNSIPDAFETIYMASSKDKSSFTRWPRLDVILKHLDSLDAALLQKYQVTG